MVKSRVRKPYQNIFPSHNLLSYSSEFAAGDFCYLDIVKTYWSLFFAVGRESETHPAFSFQHGVCRRENEAFGRDAFGNTSSVMRVTMNVM